MDYKWFMPYIDVNDPVGEWANFEVGDFVCDASGRDGRRLVLCKGIGGKCILGDLMLVRMDDIRHYRKLKVVGPFPPNVTEADIFNWYLIASALQNAKITKNTLKSVYGYDHKDL